MSPDVPLTVVIPTFERARTLARCIAALESQHLDPSAFQVVIVNDGSQDHTAAVVDRARARARFRLDHLIQEHRGPSAARNLGLKHAKGELVVFIGDDIIPTRSFLQAHLDAHRREPAPGLAVLGRTAWAPWLRVSPLMEFLELNGEQFGYGRIDDPEDVPPRFFYTSNVSLKRGLLAAGPRFDEDLFPWEDVDLALRLVPLGLRIVYRPDALAYHDHPMDLAVYLGRMRQSGESARVMDLKRGFAGRLASGERMLQENRRRDRIRSAMFPLARVLRWRRVLFPLFERRGLEEFCRGYRG